MKSSIITTLLLEWYKKNKRDLPWRKTHDPYNILVSEVMLQQTQVSRVLIKYREFLSTFPIINDLAKASPAQVITTWKGLGYNRRALFLKKTAQAIVGEHNGTFPKDIKDLCALPGIGDYTARAVLSFAFKQPVPMMDTNHRRFYQRVFVGTETKKDKELLGIAEEVLPKKNAYDFHQALMDFESLICTTKSPSCDSCPLQKHCKAYPAILTLPKKTSTTKKKVPFKETDRFVRGRIIDHLRHQKMLTQPEAIKMFKQFKKERIIKIINFLQKDQLIDIIDGRIHLPD